MRNHNLIYSIKNYLATLPLETFSTQYPYVEVKSFIS